MTKEHLLAASYKVRSEWIKEKIGYPFFYKLKTYNMLSILIGALAKEKGISCDSAINGLIEELWS